MKNILVLLFVALSFISTAQAQTLEDYFQIAAENNPALRAKYKSFEASMQRVAQVGNLPNPQLSFGYFISPVETRVGPQRAKISLTQMFPWFGTLGNQENVATYRAEANYQVFLDARNSLYYEVASVYYSLYELKKLTALESENLGILNSYKTISTSKYQNGKGSMVDVLRVDILLEESSTQLQLLKEKEKPLRSQFNALLNRPDSMNVVLADSLTLATLPNVSGKDSLLNGQPLLEELSLKIKSSEANEELITKQGLPNIGLGLDYVIVDKRTDIDMPKNGRDILMPMVSVSLPIFRSQYTAGKKEAQLMQESYQLQKVAISNSLNYSYDMALFEVQQQAAYIQLHKDQIALSRQSLNLLLSAYGNSGEEFVEVLRMQQQILRYQKMKLAAEVAYSKALAKLDYITAKTK